MREARREFRRYYWDSGVFCSFLAEEPNRVDVVRDLLREATAGRVEIVTSSFALVEVLKLKHHAKITEESQARLIEFFEYPFIKIVNADRAICELARSYVWKHGMSPKDAVHMATAHAASRVTEIHGLFSWDDDFIRMNEAGIATFQITHPFMIQTVLQLEAEVSSGSEGPEPEDSSPN